MLPGVLRVLPLLPFGRHPGDRMVERSLWVYRRTWIIIVSGFFEPLFYLLGIGFGLGHLIGNVNGLTYAQFVAPALLATAAMNGAIYDSTLNVYFKLKFARTYAAILATPVGVGDVALGEITWALIRGVLYSAVFILVSARLGDLASPWALPALPATVPTRCGSWPSSSSPPRARCSSPSPCRSSGQRPWPPGVRPSPKTPPCW